MSQLTQLYNEPLFGIALTVIFYTAAQLLNRRFNWLHPLLLTTAGIIALLLVCGIPYESYKAGGDMITFFLGPATVALAVPLYKAIRQMKKKLGVVALSVLVGSVTGLLSVAAVHMLLGGSLQVALSMLPKSVTSPVAIELARQLGGIAELGGVFAVLTGLLGSMIGPALLRLAGFRSHVAIGAAIGTASHGIGTARVLRDSELQGGISGFAMALSCIITPILCIPIYWLL